MPVRPAGWRAAATALGLAAALGCSDSSGTGTTGPGPTPGPVGSVTVGNDFFQSAHNSSRPAADTVAVGQAVTWTWANTGSTSHSVRSQGTPSFTSSGILTGDGMTYTTTFTAPGTYHYDCAVHGSLMTGTVVVQ
jgi:plastocyanin